MNPEAESVPHAPEMNAGRTYAEPRERYVDDPRRKSPRWAGVLSLVPGLGQVYVGYYQQGFQHVAVMCVAFLLAASGAFRHIEPPIVLFIIFYWLYNIVDAVRRASLYNQALAGLRPMDMPDELSRPIRIGSLGGGVTLVVAGLILFTHTMLGWSLEWVAEWWPLGLVAVGAWLIYSDVKAKVDKAAAAQEQTEV